MQDSDATSFRELTARNWRRQARDLEQLATQYDREAASVKATDPDRAWKVAFAENMAQWCRDERARLMRLLEERGQAGNVPPWKGEAG